ncbi:MAG: hypothetical protein H0X25_17680 [Acidobacteriales bacterium]|nr:hypothetical protein [Terriglobales bacterium]
MPRFHAIILLSTLLLSAASLSAADHLRELRNARIDSIADDLGSILVTDCPSRDCAAPPRQSPFMTAS